jgi:serine phosphatase RsbU (regulator of sigma subunit)
MSYRIPKRPSRVSARDHADAVLLVLKRTEVDGLLRREPLLADELLRFTNTQLHRSHHRAMREMEEKITQLAQAYTALQVAQTQLLEQERLRHELRLAREIQERMLPRELPQRAGVALGARIIPAYDVGGDFFDVFALDNETLGVVIGDRDTRSTLHGPDAQPDPCRSPTVSVSGRGAPAGEPASTRTEHRRHVRHDRVRPARLSEPDV